MALLKPNVNAKRVYLPLHFSVLKIRFSFTYMFDKALIGRGTGGANGCPVKTEWALLSTWSREPCIFTNTARIEVSFEGSSS
jgi:hypothetical protein